MIATARTTLLAVLAALAAACNRPSELPDMGVSRTALAFEAPGGTGEPSPQTLWVQNTGRGSLARPSATLAYEDGTGWLAATVSGSGAPYEIAVQPTAAGLEPGVYRATLTLASDNASSSPMQVNVTLTVPDPRFTLSVSSLAFDAPRGGANPAPIAFQVLNGGRGTLPVPQVDVSYVGTTGWLNAAVGGTPAAYVVTVSTNVTGMDSGVYTATMSISAAAAEGPPRTLGVTLTVPSPEIGVSAPEIRIDGPADGTNPAPISVAVANGGGGLLATPTATITYPPGWMGPAWLAGTMSGEAAPYTLTLQARQSGQTPRLESGTYVATMTIASPNAANSPQTLTVTLVVPPPSMRLSSSVYSDNTVSGVVFSGIAGCPPPSPSRIIVTNGGPGTLAAPVAKVPPELSAWLEAAVTGDRAPYVVTFAMKAVPGPGDVRSGDVVLDSPGAASPVSVQVWYFEAQASETPAVQVTGPWPFVIWAQDGTGDPGAQSIQVVTTGGCIPPPDVSVSYPAGTMPWISTQIVSGYGRHDIAVTASTAGMAPGESRTADLVITAQGAEPRIFPVTLRLGALVTTGPMRMARIGHTITALPEGRAFVAGGVNLLGITAAMEVYLPDSRQWIRSGSMNKARYLHGAVPIDDDGDVVICGGYTGTNAGDSVIDATCELTYIGWPTGFVGTLRLPRLMPSLVPLGDWRILVASQDGPPEILQIFSTDWGVMWTSRLVEGVSAWNAVKLADGRVLATAGQSASIYDPVRDAWTPTGSPRMIRSHPALVPLPDGRVLAVGGPVPGSANTAEIWNPATGTWTLTAPPFSEYDDSTNTIALSNGKVIAVAGPVRGASEAEGYWTYSDRVEMFDPATETWSVVATLPTRRGAVVPVRLPNGMVLMAGGKGENPLVFDEALTW